jgi:transposase
MTSGAGNPCQRPTPQRSPGRPSSKTNFALLLDGGDLGCDRRDNHPGAPLRSRRKGGIQKNALGRSRGGFSTKIHARTNADGLPIGIVITPGQAHDVTAYPALMAEVAADPEWMLADKGYDSDAARKDTQDRDGELVIPTKANRKQQVIVQKAIYGLRNRIERFFNSHRIFAARRNPLRQFTRAYLPPCMVEPGLRLLVIRAFRRERDSGVRPRYDAS